MKARILLPIVALLSTACSTMQPVSPVAYLETNNPTHVRIYSPSGMSVLEAPRLQGSTISGFDLVERADATFDVSNIQRMEVKRLDRQRTAIFAGVLTVVGGAGIYMITQKQGNDAGLICDNYDVANRCRVGNPTKPAIPLGVRLTF
jgi:hypothetical protein